jgi:hypothetical protein
MGIHVKDGASRCPEDCPTAWFAVLERAREVGDPVRAAEAEKQLRRLGVQIRFARHRRSTAHA